MNFFRESGQRPDLPRSQSEESGKLARNKSAGTSKEEKKMAAVSTSNVVSVFFSIFRSKRR